MSFVTAEHFQYGPSRNQNEISVSQTLADQRSLQPAGSSVPGRVDPRLAPPPPYSSVDLKSASLGAKARPQPVQEINKPVPAPTATVPEKYCVMCQSRQHEKANCPLQANHANNRYSADLPSVAPPKVPPSSIPPIIPPLPKQHNNNQYKWRASQDQGLNASQCVKTSEPTKHQQSTPKQTPSPTYDSGHNPYVWTSMPPTTGLTKISRTIDLDLEIPKINQRIKNNQLPNFQHLHKQLNKNKPLIETRMILINNKYLSDVKFIVGDSIFYAHKMIVITASFLFYEHFHVKGEKEMKIESINFETFEKVLSYCYTDQIKVTEDDVLELLLASNQLQVRQIVNVCHGLISNSMNHESIFIIFDKALELNNAVFQKKCLDFMKKNEQKCFTSKGFFAISLPSLMKILEACKYPREKVSDIIEKWTNGDIESSSQEPAEEPPKVTAPTAVNTQSKSSAKKSPQKKKKQQEKAKNIPGLMSLPVPSSHSGPPLISPFPYPPPLMQQQFPPQMPMQFLAQHMQQFQQPNLMPHMQFPHPNMHQISSPVIRPIRPFAGSFSNLSKKNQLISVDDDDDRESIISKDDELDAKIKIGVIGARHPWDTEISRLDLVCKRSMLLHEIRFSENLAQKCKEVRITVTVFEAGQKSDLNVRTIKVNKPGK